MFWNLICRHDEAIAYLIFAGCAGYMLGSVLV
jgi:hypothetical protein